MNASNGQVPLGVWDARTENWWVPQREARTQWLKDHRFPLNRMTRLVFYDGYAMMTCYVLDSDGRPAVKDGVPEIEEARVPLPELPPAEIL